MDSQLSSFGGLLRSRKGCKYAKIPLVAKIRLFKSVIEEGFPIKRISEKLQIKYSTAKTLVRQFKDQQIKIDLTVLQNETNAMPQRNSQNLRAGYKDIVVIPTQSAGKDDEVSEMNHTALISPRETTESNAIAPPKSLNRVEVVSKIISRH